MFRRIPSAIGREDLALLAFRLMHAGPYLELSLVIISGEVSRAEASVYKYALIPDSSTIFSPGRPHIRFYSTRNPHTTPSTSIHTQLSLSSAPHYQTFTPSKFFSQSSSWVKPQPIPAVLPASALRTSVSPASTPPQWSNAQLLKTSGVRTGHLSTGSGSSDRPSRHDGRRQTQRMTSMMGMTTTTDARTLKPLTSTRGRIWAPNPAAPPA